MKSNLKVALDPGQRVRILAWYDHVALIASRRPGVDFLGTFVRVREAAGGVTLSVRGVVGVKSGSNVCGYGPCCTG